MDIIPEDMEAELTGRVGRPECEQGVEVRRCGE